jgi:hypothetical protein
MEGTFSFTVFMCLYILRSTTYAANFPIQQMNYSVKIHIVQMIMGDGVSNLGFNIMSPAYDVALEKVSREYPRVFANYSVSRYFVAGPYSCAESEGLATTGLFNLLRGKDEESNEFRIVLSPGE